MARFPITLDSDTTEVRDALEIARTQYVRGDLGDAMKWLRRAADIAFERGADQRGVALSKAAVELGPPRPPAPKPTPPPQPRAVVPTAAPVPSPAPARPETGTARMAPSRPSVQPAPSVAPAAPIRSQVAQRTNGSAPPRASAPISSPAPAPAPVAKPAASARLPASARPTARESVDVSTEPRGRSPVADAAPIPLTARRAERPPLAEDETADEITAITAMSSGIAAALAFERAERAAPSAPPSQPAAPVRPAQPAGTAPRKAPVVARAPVQPSRPAPVIEDIPEETSPSFPLAAVLAAKAAAPVAVHQAVRVALARGAGGAVTARALGPDGLRAGEVEAMVVGVAQVTDLAALFAE